MTSRRRASRTFVAIALGSLGIGIAEHRSMAQEQATSLSASFRRAAARAKGALVSVRVPDGMRFPTPYVPTRPGRFFGPGTLAPPMVDRSPDGDVRAAFSGLVIDADRGTILTADHPTLGASQLLVTFPDGHERLTSQIRRDPRSGLAVLSVDTHGLHPTQVNWGNPTKLEPGDWLIALGQPGIGDPAMSVGVFSTRRRGAGEELIETDAAIPRIGAGGVLINLGGEVIGICKLGGRRADGFEGMGHAIPADRARRIASDLAQFGQVQRAYLGIQLEPAASSTPGGRENPVGVRVASVGAGTPAAEAGIRAGDIIIAVGQRAVGSASELQETVELALIGQDLPLTIERQGKKMEIKVRPRAVPAPLGSMRSPRSNPLIETRRDLLRGQPAVPDSPAPGPVAPGLPVGPAPPPTPVPPDTRPDPPEH